LVARLSSDFVGGLRKAGLSKARCFAWFDVRCPRLEPTGFGEALCRLRLRVPRYCPDIANTGAGKSGSGCRMIARRRFVSIGEMHGCAGNLLTRLGMYTYHLHTNDIQ
jgi:hypothetical protein